MDTKVKVPAGVHVTTAKELAEQLLPYGNKPVFFASSNISEPNCVLSVYDDKVKQVWIDIGRLHE